MAEGSSIHRGRDQVAVSIGELDQLLCAARGDRQGRLASLDGAAKRDLSQAYRDCRDWLAAGAPQVAMGAGGLTDIPANLHGNVADDTVTVNQVVSPDYMWNLYIAHVALALALETTQRLPWSIGSYTGPLLRYLFDSSRMAWNSPNGNFSMGTYAQFVPALRADNRPKTAFAPPNGRIHSSFKPG